MRVLHTMIPIAFLNRGNPGEERDIVGLIWSMLSEREGRDGILAI